MVSCFVTPSPVTVCGGGGGVKSVCAAVAAVCGDGGVTAVCAAVDGGAAVGAVTATALAEVGWGLLLLQWSAVCTARPQRCTLLLGATACKGAPKRTRGLLIPASVCVYVCMYVCEFLCMCVCV